MQMIINRATVVSLSCVGFVAAGAFWISALAKDVQANADQLKYAFTVRQSFEAEMLSNVKDLTKTMGEIQKQSAAVDAKVTIILNWADAERRYLKNP